MTRSVNMPQNQRTTIGLLHTMKQFACKFQLTTLSFFDVTMTINYNLYQLFTYLMTVNSPSFDKTTSFPGSLLWSRREGK